MEVYRAREAPRAAVVAPDDLLTADAARRAGFGDGEARILRDEASGSRVVTPVTGFTDRLRLRSWDTGDEPIALLYSRQPRLFGGPLPAPAEAPPEDGGQTGDR